MRTCGLVGAIVVSILAATRAGLAQAPAAQFPAESAPVAPKAAPAAPAAPAPTPSAAPAPAPAPSVAPAPAPSTSSPAAAAPPSAVPPSVATVTPTNPDPPRLEPDREPLVARPLPNWSIGGGIGFVTDTPLSPAPSYLAAFERRLGERAWLIVGVSASRDANEVPRSQPGGGLSNTSSTTTIAAAQLGLRYVFVQSVVDVSGELAAFGKYKNVGGSE